MRFAVSGLLLALALSAVVAEDQPLPESPQHLLDRYLHDREARPELRPKLLALGADALTRLIENYPRPPAPRAGEHKLEVTCDDGFARPYWVSIPRNYDGETPAALMVVLHGGVWGTPVDAGVGMLRWWAKYANELEAGRPVICLAASCDTYGTTQNAAWWRVQERRNIQLFVREAQLRYNIDPDRVFLTGFSDGGSGTFSHAYRSPDTFAGFFPMMGDPLVATIDQIQHYHTNLKDLNIYALTGAVDPLYPKSRIEPLYREANREGADIKYKIYDEVGHELPPTDIEFPKILAMTAEWRRDNLPGDIDWSSDLPELGRRAWLSIDETAEHDRRQNRGRAPQPRGGGAFRVDIGFKVPHDFVDDGSPLVATRIEPGSMLDRMGMKPGDTLLELDGNPVRGFAHIGMWLRTKGAGEKATVTVLRDGERMTFEDRLDTARKTHAGRVQATMRAGSVQLRTHDVARASVWVSREMLDGNQLTIRSNRGVLWRGEVTPDPGTILDEFTRTGERSARVIARIEVTTQ